MGLNFIVVEQDGMTDEWAISDEKYLCKNQEREEGNT